MWCTVLTQGCIVGDIRCLSIFNDGFFNKSIDRALMKKKHPVVCYLAKVVFEMLHFLLKKLFLLTKVQS